MVQGKTLNRPDKNGILKWMGLEDFGHKVKKTGVNILKGVTMVGLGVLMLSEAVAFAAAGVSGDVAAVLGA